MSSTLIIILAILAGGALHTAMYFYNNRNVESSRDFNRLSFISIAIIWQLCVACSSQTDRDRVASMDNSRGLPLSVDKQLVSADAQQGMSVAGMVSEDPEKFFLIVEQAVDAWLYFNISDFKSYEPLIRYTIYDAGRNVYIHHLRYRSINKEGGMDTTEAKFEVDLTSPGSNGNPFHVTPL